MRKKNLLVITVLTLGIILAACSNTGINGIYISAENPNILLALEKGNWEETDYDGSQFARGTYTISGNNYTPVITHLFGNSLHRTLEPRWYTKEEIMESGLFPDEFIAIFNRENTLTYSTSRYDFIISSPDGGTYIYARKADGRITGSITGSWKGQTNELDVNASITNIGWTLSIPEANISETGTYEWDAAHNHGRLSGDSQSGGFIGTIELINNNYLLVSANNDKFVLARQ